MAEHPRCEGVAGHRPFGRVRTTLPRL